MKNENAFNAWLSKEFRARHSRMKVFHVKASDKFTVGVSDFLLWGNGTAAALETKFVKTLNKKGEASLLEHTFTGPQLTFMESMRLAGSRAFGLVYADDMDAMYLIPSQLIPEEGNWSVAAFVGCYKRLFGPNDVDSLLGAMLWEKTF